MAHHFVPTVRIRNARPEVFITKRDAFSLRPTTTSLAPLTKESPISVNDITFKEMTSQLLR